MRCQTINGKCSVCLNTLLAGYFLWNISDKDALVSEGTLTPTQLALERVITKVFNHYSVSLEITTDICTAFKWKLYRMGIQLSKLGGKQRKQQLNNWRELVWNLTISDQEVYRQLVKRVTKQKCS